jgi:L-threonylcarbamoyladenylate synthase
MAEAVERLRAGGLVAFPTETVYGLGANALDSEAVARIFAAKGRPSNNPLIVHVPDVAAARELAGEWPEAAEKLAAKFWPGPLTLVVQKAKTVPDIVTASGPTVGLRVPNHPVALELLRASDIPIAAPSANRSEEVSPTTAQHVANSLGLYVDDLLILDGGPCVVGLESTVLDVTAEPPHILRPGMVTEAMVSEVSGDAPEERERKEIARSPGQMHRHYAPKVPLLILSIDRFRDELASGDGVIFHSVNPGRKPNSILDSHFNRARFGGPNLWIKEIFLSPVVEEYASRLYAALRDLEQAKVERIIVEEPPRTPEWAAVHDRLRRATATKSD